MSARSDVVVVGAGVFGLATAWQVVRSGRSVTVLDRAPVGTEASGWALGRLDPLLRGSGSTGTVERDLPAEQIAKPEAQQKLALDSYQLHRELTPQIEEISGIDVQVDEQPTLQLFYSEQERSAGADLASAWSSMGFPTELMSQGEIASLDSRILARQFGGALVKGPYFVDSLRFVRALASCARHEGVELETASVTSVESTSDGATVHTDQGHYEAATVILAAGPWTPGLSEPLGVEIPVHPSKGEILRLQPKSSERFGVHVHGPCSLVNKKDGLVWVAATAAEVGFDRTPSDAAREQLLENAGKMMTGADDWPILQHTVCFRPATPDDLPVVGAISDNVIVATGGGGSGIVQCLYVGQQVSAMLESASPEPDSELISLRRFV